MERSLKELTDTPSEYKNGKDVLTTTAKHTPYKYTLPYAEKSGTYYYYDIDGTYYIYAIKVTSARSMVKYDGNGNTGGAAPTDAKSPWAISKNLAPGN